MNNSNVQSCVFPPLPPANYTPFYIPEPTNSIIVRLFLASVILLISLVGNLVVIRAIRRVPGRKPLVYVFVQNVAVSELGHVLISPSTLIYEVNDDWIMGRFLCKILNPTIMLMVTNITVTLAAIAVYRFLRLARPAITQTRLSSMQTKLLVTSFWCVGLAVAIPSMVVRETVLNYDGKTRCRECWNPPSSLRPYRLATEIIIFVVPFCVMVVSYALAGIKLGQHMVISLRQNSDEYNSTVEIKMSQVCSRTPTSPIEPTVCDTHRENRSTLRGHSVVLQEVSKRIVELECDLLKMMCLIVFSFLICYIPFQVFYVLHNFRIWQKWRYGGIAAEWLQLLTLCPSALHPMLYGTRSKFFAKVFSTFVSCRQGSNNN